MQKTSYCHRHSWTRLFVVFIASLAVTMLVLSVTMIPGEVQPGASHEGRLSGRRLSSTPDAVSASCTAQLSLPIVVAPNETCWINGTGDSSVFDIEGNITVQPGGLLSLQNVTVLMIQSIGPVGQPLSSRLSNISTVLDGGTLDLRNSVLTTDSAVADAYIELNLTVVGTLGVYNSSLDFPGWIYVAGLDAFATLNDSVIGPNPDANQTDLGSVIENATSYAPAITVTNGASWSSYQTTVKGVYSDNFTTGMPGPTPLNSTQVVILNQTVGANLSAFSTGDSTMDLIQDFLNPGPFYSATLTISYEAESFFSTTVSVDFLGNVYRVGTPITGDSTNSEFQTSTYPLSSKLVSAISQAGMERYLEATGSFGPAHSEISVNFSALSEGNDVAIALVSLQLQPYLDYNVDASGNGTTFAAVDSVYDLTYASLPSSPVSYIAPYPWDSNKLVVSNHARALLVNLTTPSPTGTVLPVLSSDSAVALFYRWALFDAYGPGGEIGGTDVVAFPSLASTNVSTELANSALDKDTPLWGYLEWKTNAQGFPSIGITASQGHAAGRALLVLASGEVDNASSTGLSELNNYNIGTRVPMAGSATVWTLWNVTPIPSALAIPEVDVMPPDYFQQYVGELSPVEILVNVDGVPTYSARIGSTVIVSITLENTGVAPIWNVSGSLWLTVDSTGSTSSVASFPMSYQEILPGYTAVESAGWTISQNVVGSRGQQNVTFTASIDWDGGPGLLNGGSLLAKSEFEILPSTVAITSLSTPPSVFLPNATYYVNGSLVFNGTGSAVVSLSAVPYSRNESEPTTLLASIVSSAGEFSIAFGPVEGLLVPGINYTLVVNASYNTVTSSTYRLTGNYSEPKAALAITSLIATMDGVQKTSARIGQTLTVETTLKNVGIAYVQDVNGTIWIENSTLAVHAEVSIYSNVSDSILTDGTAEISTNWTLNQSSLGVHGNFDATVVVTVYWNGGPGMVNGGRVSDELEFRVRPSEVALTGLVPPPAALLPNEAYSLSGTAAFNGTGYATITLVAVSSSDSGAFVTLGTTDSAAGRFNLTFGPLGSQLEPGLDYLLLVNATFNSATSPNYTLERTYSISVASLELTSLEYSVAGSGLGPARIGQRIEVEVTLTNVGAANVESFNGSIWVENSTLSLRSEVVSIPLTVTSIESGGNLTVEEEWTVTQQDVGVHGQFVAALVAFIDWNGGPGMRNGGVVLGNRSVEILPSDLALVGLTTPSSILSPTANYTIDGSVLYNGTGPVRIVLEAVPVGSSNTITIATTQTGTGTFSLTYGSLGALLAPGTQYDLIAFASFNNSTSPVYHLSGTFAIPIAPTPSSISWWVWAAIVIGLVVVVGGVFVSRRIRSDSVECSECGSIVSARAAGCPACGTCFDRDESQCIHCGNQIPAGVTACPHCHRTTNNRPVRPGNTSDRESYHEHIEQFRAAAHGDLGDDFPEPSFWEWWRQQPSYQSYRDWLEGRPPRPPGADAMDKDPLGLGDGR